MWRTVARVSDRDEKVNRELLEPMLRQVGGMLAGYKTAARLTRETT